MRELRIIKEEKKNKLKSKRKKIDKNDKKEQPPTLIPTHLRLRARVHECVCVR